MNEKTNFRQAVLSSGSFLTFLPVDGVVEVHSNRAGVDDSNQEQMKSYTKVGGGQVAHEKLGDAEAKMRGGNNDYNEQISDDSGKGSEPHRNSQGPVAHQVLAGVEGVWRGMALNLKNEDDFQMDNGAFGVVIFV